MAACGEEGERTRQGSTDGAFSGTPASHVHKSAGTGTVSYYHTYYSIAVPSVSLGCNRCLAVITVWLKMGGCNYSVITV